MCVLEVFLEDVKMFTSVCLTFSFSLSFFFFFLLLGRLPMVLMVVVPALCCRSWGERQKGGVACVHMTCSSTVMNIFKFLKIKKYKIENK